jgi:DNA-cytosine methyltransferase
MNVLSCFDGMSCGQIALNKVGVKYDNYYAAEIDTHAIKVTGANYPNTIQLGDVTKIKAKDLPQIDLLIGGSPCQGFSFAGKQLNFNDPRSKLFFEFVRLLDELKPKYFLLENVKMKKEFEDIITFYMGVAPLEINSKLISAQGRKRLYWTNIDEYNGFFGPGQPERKDIILKDILQQDVPDEYYIDLDRIEKLLDAGIETFTFRNTNKRLNKIHQLNKTNLKFHGTSASQSNRIYDINGKAPCLVTSNSDFIIFEGEVNGELKFRRITPIEAERLQTVPDNYTNHVTKNQRYHMLGNGWTVDVIAHIFKNLKNKHL